MGLYSRGGAVGRVCAEVLAAGTHFVAFLLQKQELMTRRLLAVLRERPLASITREEVRAELATSTDSSLT